MYDLPDVPTKARPLGIVLAEHRIGDARDERIRALERREQIEVDARRIDRLAEALVESLDVRGAKLALHRVHNRLVADHLFGDLAVARGERSHRELEVLNDLRMEIRDLAPSLRRKDVVAANLLLGELHEVLVDDVADLLESDDHEDEGRLALRLLLGEIVLAKLHEGLLGLVLEPADDV